MPRANVSDLLNSLPQLEAAHFRLPEAAALRPAPSTHAPRIALLYGSLRPRSFSRLLTEEAARLLQVQDDPPAPFFYLDEATRARAAELCAGVFPELFKLFAKKRGRFDVTVSIWSAR